MNLFVIKVYNYRDSGPCWDEVSILVGIMIRVKVRVEVVNVEVRVEIYSRL